MAKQIVEATRGYVPASSIQRSHGNSGLAVKFDDAAPNPSQAVDFPVQVSLTNTDNAAIKGVLLEYNSANNVRIGKRGIFRFKTAGGDITAAMIGDGIVGVPPGTGNADVGKVKRVATGGTGEIVAFDNANDWVWVDINLP